MSLLVGTRRALLRGGKAYRDKVLATGPIVYWIQGETSGSVAYCQIDSAQNGAYTGVTLGQTGIGDGRTAPLYDGVNDYTNIYSVALNAAFNGAEGSLMCWGRVTNVGVWGDAAERRFISLYVDVNNLIQVRKTGAADTLDFRYRAGGVTQQRTIVTAAPITWMQIALTWRAGIDEVRAYYNGAQQGVVLVGLGVWAGNLAATRCLIGANTTVPALPWDGWLGHGAIWDRALSSADIADLAVL